MQILNIGGDENEEDSKEALLRRLRMLQVLMPKALAEMVGTFAMIFVGGGSSLLVERGIVPAFCIPIAWGLVIGLMIFAVGNISGAHFNPVVTLASVVTKRLPSSLVFVYWGSQFIGGLSAVGLLAILKKI